MELALVCFYLSFWRSSGECTCRDDTAYRTANNTADLDAAPIIAIDRAHGMGLDGRPVTLEQLRDDLVTLSSNFALLHPQDSRSARYILAAERETRYRVIADVQAFAASAGYDQPDYLVQVPGPWL